MTLAALIYSALMLSPGSNLVADLSPRALVLVYARPLLYVQDRPDFRVTLVCDRSLMTVQSDRATFPHLVSAFREVCQ